MSQSVNMMNSLIPTNTTTTGPSLDMLPIELRLKIWKLSLQPRRVILMRAGDRPPMSTTDCPLTLVVNYETHEFFNTSYTKCFHELGQKGIYLNFDIDTLCFKSAIKGFRKMVRQYPESMSEVKFIDVKAQHRGSINEQQLPIDLTPLKSLQKLTVRWNMGEYQRRSAYSMAEVCDTFKYLKEALEIAALQGTWTPTTMPKIAFLLVADIEHDPEGQYIPDGTVYVETGVDFEHGSWGFVRRQSDSLNDLDMETGMTPNQERLRNISQQQDLLGDFEVDWIEKDVVFAPPQIPFGHSDFVEGGYKLSLVDKACEAHNAVLSGTAMTRQLNAVTIQDRIRAEEKKLDLHLKWAKS